MGYANASDDERSNYGSNHGKHHSDNDSDNDSGASKIAKKDMSSHKRPACSKQGPKSKRSRGSAAGKNPMKALATPRINRPRAEAEAKTTAAAVAAEPPALPGQQQAEDATKTTTEVEAEAEVADDIGASASTDKPTKVPKAPLPPEARDNPLGFTPLLAIPRLGFGHSEASFWPFRG